MQGIELSAPCVVIVADADDRLQVLRHHIEPLAVLTHEVGDCRAAIERARECDVAMILIDLQLPMMDGLEAVRVLRSVPRTAHVPVILIADGRMGLKARQHGQTLGAVAVLHRQDLDFNALQEQMRILLDLHLRANALQVQIYAFLDDHVRLAANNPQVRALQPGLHRHLLMDLLTGLPNRIYFDLHLMGLIRRGKRGGKGFGVVWMDLDHLKRVNERYQRSVGDQVLLGVAQRLEALVRSSDVLARIEGDTYGLILDNVGDARTAQAALKKLLARVGEPLELKGANGKALTLIPTLSVGVALYPQHGDEQLTLMQVAQQSARAVLRGGGDGVRVGWSLDDPSA